MLKNNLLKSFILFATFQLSYAQEVSPEKRSLVKRLETQAEKSFNSNDYFSSIALYKEIDSISPGLPNVQCNIGICYLHSRHKASSLPYFQTAKEQGYKKKEIYFYLGEAYHYNHQFDAAQTHFQYYLDSVNTDSSSVLFSKELARRKIEICGYAKELIEDSLKVSIENIGTAINSEYDDYVPLVSSDQKTMYFTSRRPSEFNNELHDDGKHFEDIHISVKDNNGKWLPSKILDGPLNKPEHDACISLTADAKTMFLYRTKKEHPSLGSIYFSKFENNSWSKPEALEGDINSRGWESSISVSVDNKKLYFSSDRPGGSGGFDIWVCDIKSDGKWGEPKNLGPSVNTKYNEDCPFIHTDNRTLFFSSDGHKTMGGFDIFSTVYLSERDSWSKPKNVGYPVNSVEDDMYFIYASDGSKAYISSSIRPDARGKDIYVINRPSNSADLITLKGKILNADNNNPVLAKVTVTDLENNNVVAIFDADAADGKYAVSLNKGKKYSFQFEADDMLFNSQNVDLSNPEVIFSENKSFALKPIKKGNQVVLNNIFFDYNRYDLKKESIPELEKLAEFLKKNPQIQIQVNGFTDSIGNDLYNLRLSKKRANEVRSYLRSKNVPQRVIIIDGFGENKPIASNGSPEGQRMNRRTEYEIYDIDTLTGEQRRLFTRADTSNSEDIILDGIISNKKQGVILYPTVSFEYNEGKELNEASKKQLDQIASAMKRIPKMKLSIYGYTDNVGKEYNNKKLYEIRIKSVMDYLTDLGLEEKRFTVVPYKSGKKALEQARASEENRKVKFSLLDY